MKTSTHRPLVLLAGLLGLLAACAPEPTETPVAAETDPLVGTWRAVLSSPGGELPFTLEVTDRGEGLVAAAVNGAERAPFSHVTREGRLVQLETRWYDSGIQAELGEDGESMRGSWQRVSAEGAVSRLPFVATKDDEKRFLPLTEAGIEPAAGSSRPSIAGVWDVEFVDPDKTEPARGEFTQVGDHVLGTFLTPTGDYRYLEGTYEDGVLRLSTFDGAHAFLFRATAQPDGSLEQMAAKQKALRDLVDRYKDTLVNPQLGDT